MAAAAAGPFGEAAEPRQLLITGASFGMWLALQRLGTGPLISRLFGARVWASRTAEERRRCGISVTSFVFSSCLVTAAAFATLLPSAGVAADPIYGRCGFLQACFAVVVGFFMWNIFAENEHSWAGWPNFVHHVCCLIAYVMVQFPFSPRIGSALMLFEASTPALCTFNTLRTLGLEGSALYRISRVAFAILFFVFRLVLGLALTARWYMDMQELVHDNTRQVHSFAVFYVSLALPPPFLLVQAFWFRLIVRQACRRRNTDDKCER